VGPWVPKVLDWARSDLPALRVRRGRSSTGPQGPTPSRVGWRPWSGESGIARGLEGPCLGSRASPDPLLFWSGEAESTPMGQGTLTPMPSGQGETEFAPRVSAVAEVAPLVIWQLRVS
jgi:hypothetical protein